MYSYDYLLKQEVIGNNLYSINNDASQFGYDMNTLDYTPIVNAELWLWPTLRHALSQ